MRTSLPRAASSPRPANRPGDRTIPSLPASSRRTIGLHPDRGREHFLGMGGGIEVMIQEQRRRRTLLGERAQTPLIGTRNRTVGTQTGSSRGTCAGGTSSGVGRIQSRNHRRIPRHRFFSVMSRAAQTLRDEKGDVTKPRPLFPSVSAALHNGTHFRRFVVQGAFRCAMAVWHVSRRPVYR